MAKDEKRIENIANNIKVQLLSKNTIDKYCRMSLGILFIAVALTMILLVFNMGLFKLPKVLNISKLLVFEMVFVFLIMIIRVKNEDNIVNKFLDEIDNK
ncbi:MAG: hypothetical protein IJ086_04315 [Clostridium sp.]|nr:hypothetical protein [Clostridium sp.]